ncbi:MAG: hypothetical protein KAR79_02885 [Simkaniaceae bacterium]|nr:hypothetical protein [Simkaniaceae bacterium]
MAISPFQRLLINNQDQYFAVNNTVRAELSELDGQVALCQEGQGTLSTMATVANLAITFFGLGTVAILSTSFAPTYTLYFLSSFSMFIYPTFNSYFTNSYRAMANNRKLEEERTLDIIERINNFPVPSSNYEMMIKLFQMNISPQNIQHTDILRIADPEAPLRALIPIVSTYQHWVDSANKAQDKANEFFARARSNETQLIQKRLELRDRQISLQTISHVEIPETTTSIAQLEHEIEHLAQEKKKCRAFAYRVEEYSWLPQKINAAFHLHLIHNICEQRNIEDFGSIKQEETAFARSQNRDYHETNSYFEFTNPAQNPIDREWLKTATIAEVCQSIFESISTDNAIQAA